MLSCESNNELKRLVEVKRPMLRIRTLCKVIYRSCKSHSQCYDCVRLGNDAVGGSQMTCDPESVLYSFKLAREDDQNTIQCCKYTFENNFQRFFQYFQKMFLDRKSDTKQRSLPLLATLDSLAL